MDLRLTVDVAPSLVDDPVRVRVTGAEPDSDVDLTVHARDAAGIEFRSHSVFRADGAGIVDVCRHAPIGGDYDGVDAFGMWWSMTCTAGYGFSLGLPPVVAQIDVVQGDAVVATAVVERRCVASTVRTERVTEGAVSGALFLPAQLPAPGVVVLGGSGGGLHWSATTAALLASRGFCAFASAFFGAPGRPRTLNEIPVEDPGDALRWLLRRPEVVGDTVGVVGRSRGAELALQVAALHEEAGPVVAFSASGLRWTGFDPASSQPRAAWTWCGRDLAYLVPDQEVIERAWTTSPVALRAAFARALEDDAAVARSAIPVEDIRAPILLVSGSDDQLWPAETLSDIVMQRRRGLSSAQQDEHLVFDDAGHSVGQPAGLPLHDDVQRHPVDGQTYLLGGTRAGNAASGAVAWPRVRGFLSTHLGFGDGGDAAR